jgi:flagellar biosynthesis/type III secretory pathway protein FliH
LSDSSSAPAASAFAFRQLDGPATGPGGGEDHADVQAAVRAEAEQIRAQARAAGEAEGRAAALAAVRAEAESSLSALGNAVQSVVELQSQAIASLERDATELALALSEQILAGALSVEPERVLDVTRNALRHLAERRRVTVVVNPADLELVSQAAERLRTELGGIEHLAVQSDRRIGPGGAVARTEAGEIDAAIETQLARAREIAAAALAGGAAGDDAVR